jgi:outer membrane protein assembly factor BamB
LTTEEKRNLALRTGIMSGIFTTIVCVVMLLNFWQLQATSPLDNKTLELLTDQYQKNTGNRELIEEIRKIDLMARRAYFTRQWQIRTGAWLLLAGSVVTVLAFRSYFGYRKSLPLPDTSDLGQETERLVSRRWILYSMVGFFAAALLASWISVDLLTDLPQPIAQTATADEEQVEEITIQPAADNVGRGMEEERIAEKPDTDAAEESTAEPDIADAEQPAEAVTEGSGKTETAVEKAWSGPSREQVLGQFPSFRGPFGLGIAGASGVPVDWDGASGKNVLWKVPIPDPGYNSPVLWGNRLFLSGADESRQFIYCYDTGNGAMLWSKEIAGVPRSSAKVPDVTDDTGYAAPSVATNGRHVFAIFATGDVVCLDYQGNQVWARNLGLPDNHYGHSSSLLVWQGLLYVQFDTNESGRVLALDIAAGEIRWDTPRETMISWASPILAPVGDGFQLVLSSSPLVAAYDPLTGAEIWSMDCLSGEVGPSPGYRNGIVYAANEYASLVAIKAGSTAEKLWETNEYLPEVASPVAAEQVVYVGTSYGVIACYSTDDGSLLWEYEADNGFYASPVIAGGNVYFLDMDGKMHIFKTGTEKELVGTPELGEQSVCTPAFSDGRIYLRSKSFLYCIAEG